VDIARGIGLACEFAQHLDRAAQIPQAIGEQGREFIELRAALRPGKQVREATLRDREFLQAPRVPEFGRERFERVFVVGFRLDRDLIGGDGLIGSPVVGVQAAEPSMNLGLLFGGHEFGEAFEIRDERSVLSELLAQTR